MNFFKIMNFFKSTVTKIYKKLKKLRAKLIYSLPIISKYNPRNKLTTFKDWCAKIESFPGSEEMMPKDWYLLIRPCETIQRRLPISLNEDETDKYDKIINDCQFGYKFTIPEVFLSCINQGKIFSNDFIVCSPDNYIFFDSIYSHYPLIEDNGILDKIRLPPLNYYSGSYCVLGMLYGLNYYHWILEILPRLSLIEQFEELRSIPLIVPKELKAFQKESLQLAGVSPERIVEFDGGFWQVDNLYFPSLLSITGSPSPNSVSWLRTRFLDKSCSQQPLSQGYLYLTRRDAQTRRVLNEDTIVEYLKDIGFQIICPGELSFLEQITTFSNAKVVVASHGAALTNMVFAPPNTVLIEIFSENYMNGCYWALANICMHNYAFLIGSSKGQDLYIPLDKLKKLLDKMVVNMNEVRISANT